MLKVPPLEMIYLITNPFWFFFFKQSFLISQLSVTKIGQSALIRENVADPQADCGPVWRQEEHVEAQAVTVAGEPSHCEQSCLYFLILHFTVCTH